MSFWREQLYLIDHGATLTFQHRWESAASAVSRPYDASEHALIGCDLQIEAADAALGGLITAEALAEAVAEVPVDWLNLSRYLA